MESPSGMNHEQLFVFGGTFFFGVTVKQRKGVSRGGGKSLREQEKGTGTYGNSTCSPMFPEHVTGTLMENLSLVGNASKSEHYSYYTDFRFVFNHT